MALCPYGLSSAMPLYETDATEREGRRLLTPERTIPSCPLSGSYFSRWKGVAATSRVRTEIRRKRRKRIDYESHWGCPENLTVLATDFIAGNKGIVELNSELI